MLTLEEQERRAYVDGDVRAAELLAQAVDDVQSALTDELLRQERRADELAAKHVLRDD